MYEKFYGLTEKPFSIQPDPDFLFFGKRHSLAYTMLEYGVENGAGFSVLTGEIGSGKTTLIRHLLSNLPDTTTVGLITNTHKEMSDILKWVMLAFGQPYDGMSAVALYDAFQTFLIEEYAAGRRIILIVDEAQNLSPGALEVLRILSNVNADKHMILQLILTGQPELKDLLSLPKLKQFAQRVSVEFHITPLKEKEVKSYILHRLKVAGCKKIMFTREAAESVAKLSKGIPRNINILCDTALVYGMAADASMINAAIIEEVVHDKQKYGVLFQDDSSDDGSDDGSDDRVNSV